MTSYHAYPNGVTPPPPAPLGFENFESVLGPGTNYVRFLSCHDCAAFVLNDVVHRKFHDSVNKRLAIAELYIAELRAADSRSVREILDR